MRIRYLCSFALLVGLFVAVGAQAQSRSAGWEFRADILYQNQKDLNTSGGSQLFLDTDWGGSLGAGYRFNPYVELQFLVDFQSIGYDASIVNADTPPKPVANVSDDVDIFTPRLVGNFNFLNSAITPYVSAGIGWSSVSASVPSGRTGCWWDPWWGYVCGQYENTYGNDRFEYDIGAGVRWDFTANFSMRFAYEKHWVDLSGAAGVPNLDQFRIGFQFGY